MPSVLLTKALTCLALNSYHEARSEPIQGQVAVAQVVLRRANFDERRVCREVYRHKQFSWTATPRKPANAAAWQRAVYAARVAMLWAKGAPLVDHSQGADHYHADYVEPYWARRMVHVTTIGEHHFYRRKR